MQERSDFIYGINPVFEVIRADRRTFRGALLSKSAARNPRIQKLASFLERQGIRVDWAEKGRLVDLCGSPDNQGAVLECGPYPYVPFAEQLSADRLLLLDNIEDPQNVGAIMRSAEAFGFQSVLLPRRGSVLVRPSVVKTSAGACEYLNVSCNCSINQYVKIAVEEGYILISLDAKGQIPLEKMRGKTPEKLLLVVGGENKGVGQFILNKSHHVLRIDQFGRVNSLNTSVAAAIAMQTLASPGTSV
ncbi:MAG: RNA methyltransferase [Lentisphaeria bacterium]|nr:RNA methyltransferase [Lentisphaeria bacterium]